ncbi:MAG TPA: fatty acid CoA ligase family protein [Myxococcota bacterium]
MNTDVTVRDLVEAVSHRQPNACDLIHEVARKDPTLPAVVDHKSGTSLTFGALSTQIAKLASRLQGLGVSPRDRVALFIADGPRFVTLVNALFHLGAVPVLIDPGMGLDNVAACIKEQKPRALVGIKKAQALRLLRWSAFSSVKVNVVVDGIFPGAHTLRTDGDDKDVYLGMHRQAADVPAAVLYTSGSTGAPKGVLYTHGMLMAQATAIRDMFAIQRGDVDVCCFLPFALFSVAMGTTAVFPAMDFSKPAKASPEAILKALRDPLGTGKAATSAFASPALWGPFSWFASSTNQTVPGLKRVLTAGAPVSPKLHERLLKAVPDGDVWTPYGATEALPVAFMNGRRVLDETAAATRAGKGTCVGTVAPRLEVKIIGITDAPVATMAEATTLPTGAIGEIVVTGACVTVAYDATSERAIDANAKSKIVDGERIWHRMGDVGYLDAQGRLWFCGRKAHRVETAQGPLYSIPVEAVAEEQWPARAALVWRGERPNQRAVVVLENPQKVAATPGSPAPKTVTVPSTSLVSSSVAQALGRSDFDVIVWPSAFPVDRRHNAKIEREQLAANLPPA